MRRGVLVLVAALLGAGAPASAAFAAGGSTGGATKVWVTPSNSTTSVKHPGKVVFTGAIGDYGTSVSATATGKPSKKKSTYKLLKLTKGTILVTTVGFTKALTSASPSTSNTTTCSFVVSAGGPVTIVKGTGAYSGITGKFTLTGTFAAILAKKNGACTTKSNPVGSYVAIQGSGTVSF